MTVTRTKNVVLIMTASTVKQVLNLILQFISRTVFIYVLGAEYLGLNGLFSNILSLLSLTELGIGSAISFYLYKPLAENNIERIKTLMSFYKVCYRIIGLSMLGIGICIMPLLPKMVNFNQRVPVNLYLVYFLYLLNTVASYLILAYKQALPMANQELYKIEKINIIYVVVNCVADITVLMLSKNYILYLIVKLLCVILKNVTLAIKIDYEYPYLKEKSIEKIRKNEISEFFKNLKDAAIFRTGSALYNSTDNIIISVILGTVIVGYYSNYYMIISAIFTFIGLFIKAFSAGIGDLIARENEEIQYKYFLQIDFLVYFFLAIITACMFQGFNSWIRIWIGVANQNYILSQTVVAFLCISFYIDGSTQVMNIFREASGHFKIGKNFQIIGGLLNIVLSILFGKLWGLEGIFASTIICKGFVSLVPFSFLVSKVVFNRSETDIVKHYFKYAIVAVSAVIVSWYINQKFHMTSVLGIFIELFVTVVVMLLTLCICFGKSEEMQAYIKRLKNYI